MKYRRKYGTKCSMCSNGISPTEIIRRANEHVYHLNCFMCRLCQKQLKTGDEFYLLDNGKLICKIDYETTKAKG